MERIISIIGSNSFLALRYLQYLKQKQTDSFTFHLYGSNAPTGYEKDFTLFRIPEHPLNYEQLLKSEVIIYFVSAGVQSSKKYDTDLIYAANVFEPVRLINWLNDAGYTGKIITFGSYFEIGNNNTIKYFTELEVAAASTDVPNDYCISKRMLTRYMQSNKANIQWYHLILASVYGAGENDNRLIPHVVSKLLHKAKVQLSSGEQIRQYIHADDVSALILYITENSMEAGIYNITSDEAITVKELVHKIEECLHTTGDLNFGEIQKTDQRMKVLLLDNSKIKESSDWRPSVSLEKGIKEYIKI